MAGSVSVHAGSFGATTSTVTNRLHFFPPFFSLSELRSCVSLSLSLPLMAASISVQPGRFRVLKEGARRSDGEAGPVVYWMFRDQRLRDNWALIHAVDRASRADVPVAVAFNLFDRFLGAKARQLGFMLRGLKQLHREIEERLGIPFFLFQVSAGDFWWNSRSSSWQFFEEL